MVPSPSGREGEVSWAIGGLLGLALLSWLITGLVRRYALRAELLDVPNERSLHRTPTPRGGGLAIATVTLGGIAAGALLSMIPADVAWALGVGGALVAAVGWQDDRRGVRASVRALVHAAAACWAAYWIWGAVTPAAVAGIVCVIWATSLYNFMDGIDGLAGAEAGSVGVIAGALFLAAGHAGLALVAFIVAAAAAGFLGWNWAPARIFMGDVGSGFLGYTFGVLSLIASRSGALPLALGLLLAGVFAFDATVTLVRRMARGEHWYRPHRSHAYQRLVQTGRSHAAVTTGVILVNLGLGALAWLARSGRISVVAAVLAGILVLTVLYLAIERRRPMFPRAPASTLP
jgi:Fuc2NAc and GlcNAc transferase